MREPAKLCFPLILAACSTVSVDVRPLGSERYPPTEPASIVIYDQEGKAPPSRETVGLLTWHTIERGFFRVSQDRRIRALRREAAELGAHAVIMGRADGMVYGPFLWPTERVDGFAEAIRHK